MSPRQLDTAAFLSAPAPSGRRVVVFAGGKGGVGTSVVALNVAIELAQQERRVVFVERDARVAHTSLLFEPVLPRDRRSRIGARIRRSLFPDSRSRFSDPCSRVLNGGQRRLRLVWNGAERDAAPADGDQSPASLEAALGECDALLIDGTARDVLEQPEIALAANPLLLVTTTDPAALVGTYAMLKLLKACGLSGGAGVVVNRVRSWREADRLAERLSAAAQRFLGLRVEMLGYLLADEHLAAAARERWPVALRYPRCAASSCIKEIARRLAQPAAAPSVAAGWWGRVASLFL